MAEILKDGPLRKVLRERKILGQQGIAPKVKVTFFDEHLVIMESAEVTEGSRTFNVPTSSWWVKVEVE